MTSTYNFTKFKILHAAYECEQAGTECTAKVISQRTALSRASVFCALSRAEKWQLVKSKMNKNKAVSHLPYRVYTLTKNGKLTLAKLLTRYERGESLKLSAPPEKVESYTSTTSRTSVSERRTVAALEVMLPAIEDIVVAFTAMNPENEAEIEEYQRKYIERITQLKHELMEVYR